MNAPAGPALARLNARGHLGIKRGLDNIRALLRTLGNPERSAPAVLIAGTNGKGSTGALLEATLLAAGHRVGWTTSPHLVHPRERIRVAGAPVSEARLEALLGEVFTAEAALGIEATYFELMVAAAFLAFREVDLALVEVGLGGRWDATNASDPILTVLTTVGLDHQQLLGDTREAIGREKLCTARTGRPLVLGPNLDPDWIAPLLECAPVLHRAPALAPESLAWDHSIVLGHRLALAGAHQAENLATALEAVVQLRALGVPIDDEAVWRGAASVAWPGRLWRVPELSGVWMDGAHNPDGAKVLADHALACGVRPRVLFGAMGDKDLRGVAAELLRFSPADVTFVRGADPRYADAAQLREAWDLQAPMLDLPAAARLLRDHREGTLLVTGSLYLLGDLLRELGLDPWG
ncbi:MAG TPA: hypothetical protein VJ600_03800 [Holophagaceae bacterium]|nr:hypothetical protein [Holophagaceae bacterium]